MLLDPKLFCEGVGWEHRPHHCTQGHQNHLPGFVVCEVTVPLYLTVKRNHTTESSHTQPHAYIHKGPLDSCMSTNKRFEQ